MPTSSGTPDSIVLSGEQLSQLEAQYPGLGETIRGFKQKTSDVQAPATTTGPVNEYAGIATEHAEFIKTHNSLEIAGWLGDKLNIASWKAGAFHGERKVLSTPTGEEMARLQEFTKALGKSWTGANGGSDNHSQFLLLDGYVQNALFGEANMTQVNERLDTFHTDWQKMKKDFAAKAQYLKDKVGLDIKDDWTKLTGVRDFNGGFVGSGVLYASGGLDGVYVHRVWLDRDDSNVDFIYASFARLCFLA
ncbi:hypothetical protein KA057_00830 [Candidatus Gracilibacteria bacterium]|nr:hypothetical protein [Candidatus Gracilibacteria bacterium]